MPAALVLFLVGVALFVVPHRSRNAPASKRSLAGSFADLLRERIGGRPLRRAAIYALGCLACGSVLLPAVVLVLVQQLAPAAAAATFLAAALVLLAATAAVTLVIAVTHANFGFGGGSTRDGNLFTWLIPFYVGACTVVCLVAFVSEDFALWVRSR